jgi:hypothetical protein
LRLAPLRGLRVEARAEPLEVLAGKDRRRARPAERLDEVLAAALAVAPGPWQ